MSSPYLPVLFFFACGIGFAAVSVLGLRVFGPRRFNSAKYESYECGIQPSPRAQSRGRVPVKYYTIAMLFIVFDIESVFLLPFAVSFDRLGTAALVEMVLFVLTVFVAYVYVWRRGGLEWD